MLGTVFKVLGIIGIILLIILAIAIILVVFVVFAPLNYKFIFKYDKDKEQKNICFLKLNWLCHIIRCRIDIGLKGVDYELRIFGIKSKLLDKYLGNKDDEDYSEDYGEEDKDCDYNDYESISSAKLLSEVSQHELEDNIYSNRTNESDDLLDEIEEIWEDLISEPEYEYQEEEIKNKFSWKKLFSTNPVKLVIGYIKIIKKRIKGFISAIINTIKALMSKYEIVIEFWDRKSTQVAIERIIDYIYRLCKHIKPKRTKIKVEYGFDDPALTGQVLGAVGVVYGFVGEIIEVNPDFEEEKMEVDCLISGKMRVLNLGIIVIKVVRDKAIKRLLKNIDKLKEDLRNVR